MPARLPLFRAPSQIEEKRNLLKELRVPLRSRSGEDVSGALTWPAATVSLRYRERIRCPGRAGTQKEALHGPDSRSMVPGEPRAAEGARSVETERTVSGAGLESV